MENENNIDQPEVIEGEQQWEQDFNKKFAKGLEATGKPDWKQYQYTRNRFSPKGRALDLSKSKLLFVSTAGTYLKDSQEPFDNTNMLGDYNLRRIPVGTPFEDMEIAHDHYDHQFIKADPEVLLPFESIAEMLSEGKLGSMAAEWISISGFQPNIVKVKRELSADIVKIAQELEVQAVLLVPA